jgi:Rho-related BTB domain-containing protein 1/2
MWEQLKRRSSYQALPTVEPKKDIYRDLHHPVFQNIRIVQVRFNKIQVNFNL